MTTNAGAYELLAKLVEYPGDQFVTVAALLSDMNLPTPAFEAISRYGRCSSKLEPHEHEEQYIRTFEVQSRCCLEAGWHLFGESYKRGALLVKLRVACRAHHVPESTELPDHLSVLLRLLARLTPDDDPRGLAEEVILPAVDKMVAALDGKEPSPYHPVLAAIALVLRADFQLAAPEARAPNAFHLPVFTAEMEP